MESDNIKVVCEFSQQVDPEQTERTIRDIKEILKSALFAYLDSAPAFCEKGEER